MSLTISASQVADLIANPSSINGYSASGPIIITGAITFTQASNLNAVDATYIQATVSETTVANLGTIAVNNSTRASLNKFSFVVSDTSATASELNAAQAKTSVGVDASNITSIEASDAASISTLYSSSTTGLGNEAISVNDSTVSAATLNSIITKTSGAVTTTATTISGNVSDVETSLESSSINGFDNQDHHTTGDGTGRTAGTYIIAATGGTGTGATFKVIVDNNGEADDAGDITVVHPGVGYSDNDKLTLPKAGAYGGAGPSINLLVNGLKANNTHAADIAVTITDTSVAAEALNDVDGLTTGLVTVTSATTLTGTASEVQTALTSNAAAGGITGLSAVNVTLDDPSTAGTQAFNVADVRGIINSTTGKVTATITETVVDSLTDSTNGVTGTGHSLTMTVTDTGITAAEINALDAVTTQNLVLAPSNTGVAAFNNADHHTTGDGTGRTAGTYTIAATGGNGTGAVFKVIVDSNGEADDAGDITIVNPGTGYQDDDVLTLPKAGNYGGTKNSINIQVNGVTTGGVVAVESSSYSDVVTAFNASGVTGLSSSAVTVSGNISVAQANALDLLTTGAITATINESSLSALANLTGTGNAYTIEVGDVTADAAALVTLIGKTSVNVDINTVNTITGTLANIDAFYDLSGSVSNEGNEAVTVSDTSLDATLLNDVNDATSGIVTVSATNIFGPGDEIKTSFDQEDAANGINGLTGAETVTITGDAGSTTVIQADDLKHIDDNDTTGLITIDSSATSITGTYANVSAVLKQNKTRADANDTTGVETPTISGLDNLAVEITGGSVSLTEYKNLQNNYTTGVITATIAESSAATVLTETVTGTNDLINGNAFSVSVSDTDITAADLIEINSMTSGLVTLTHKGVAAFDNQDHHTTGDGAGRTAGTYTIAATGGSGTGAVFKVVVDANGEADDANDITIVNRGAGYADDEVLTLPKTGAYGGVGPSINVQINGVSTAPTITGSVSELKTVFDAAVASGNGIAGLGDAIAVVSGSGVNADAADLVAIKAKTSGNLDITNVSRITGLLTDVNSVLTDANSQYVGEGSEFVTLTDATISASDLATLLANGNQLTDKSVTIIASTITGSESEVSLILADTIQTAAGGLVKQHDVDNGDDGSTVVTGLAGINVTLSGTPTAAQVNAIATTTTGVVTATIDPTQTMAQLTAGLTETIEATGGHNLTITLRDTEITATKLKELSTYTTGTITLDTDSSTTGNQSPAVSGSYADINTVFNDSKISGLSASALTITGGATVSQINSIADKTTGLITATVSDGDMATLAGITETTNALSIAVTDASIDAAALNALDAKTTGLVNVTANSTLTGSYSDIQTALAATSTINDVETIKVAITGSVTIAEANAIADATSGAVSATITETDLDALVGSGVAAFDGQDHHETGDGTGRTAGTYVIAATGGAGTGAIFKVVIGSDGAADAAGDISIINPGNGYNDNDVLTLTKTNTYGGTANSITVVANGVTDGLESGNAWTVNVASQSPASTANGVALDTVISAANLATLDGLTTEVVNVSAPTIEGTLAQITSSFNANSPVDLTTRTISGLETKAVTITDVSITKAEAITAQALTTGVVTATIGKDDILTDKNETNLTFKTGVGTFGSVDHHTTGDGTGRTAGTYIIAATGGNGTGATFKVIVDSNGEADDANDITVVNPGKDYQANDVLTLPKAGKYGGTGNSINLTVTALASNRGVTTYTDVAATGGTGTGATFDVAVDSDGVASLTINNSGSGYVVDDTLTIADSDVGGSGVANITVDVASIGKDNIADFISTTTNAQGVTSTDIDPGNAFSVVFEDATIDAADLLTANSLTNGLITLTKAGGGATAIIGTQADVKSVYAAEASIVNSVAVAPGITSIADSPITIRGTVGLISAADLVALNADTTGLITVTPTTTTITGISGSYADVHAVLTQDNHVTDETTNPEGEEDPTISGMFKTTGAITGFDNTDHQLQADGAGRTAGTYIISATGGSGYGAKFKVIVDANGQASDAGDITMVDSGAGYQNDEVLTLPKAGAYGGTGNSINLQVNLVEDVSAMTVTLTGSTTIAQLNDIATYTSVAGGADGGGAGAQGGIGTITATVSETDMTTLDGLTSTAGNYSVTVGDASVAATNLNTLDGKTTGTVTVNSSTLTGALAVGGAVDTALSSAGISGLAGIAVSSDDANNTVAEVNNIAGQTTGAVTATISETAIATLAGINETGNAYAITVADASLAAASLNVLNGKTTGLITVNSTTITGALSDIKAAYDANTAGEITGLGNEAITVTDSGSISSEALNSLNALTTGVVTVNAATTVTGTLSQILSSYSDSNLAGVITGLSNEAVTITDTGSISAADLNTANSKTTGVVNVSNASTITGTYTEVNAAYTANAAGTISGLGNEAVIITDTTSITVAQANALDALTSGVITATVSSNDIDTLATLTGTGNAYSITVTDSSVAADKLNTLEGKTTSAVAVTSNTVTGTASAIKSAYTSAGITGLGSEAVSVTGSVSVADVNIIGGYTTGTLTATVSDGDVATLKGITESGNSLSVTVTDSSVAAADLAVLDAATNSVVNVNSTTLTGTNAEQLAAYTAHKAGTISGLDKTFDAASYLASHEDLLKAYGSDTVLAKSHFFDYGIGESRNIDSFDETTYLASYTDLLEAFGSNTASAVTHYVNHGYSENRAVDNFDELGYIASYADLITAFGADATAAANHYVNFGYAEKRSVTFDAASYLAAEANSDLRTAFGSDLELAKQHYINFGVNENRSLA